MINKQDFFQMLSKYENDVANFLLSRHEKFILVKGVKFIGKTSIIYNIFEREFDFSIIYHTGCDPTKRQQANGEFLKILKKYEGKNCLVVMDEYYHNDIVNYLLNHDNFKSILFVNNKELKIDNAVSFYVNEVYEEYKKHFFKDDKFDWKYKNIREIVFMLDNPQFNNQQFIENQEKYENLRGVSNVTQTIVKHKGKVDIYKIEFGENQ